MILPFTGATPSAASAGESLTQTNDEPKEPGAVLDDTSAKLKTEKEAQERRAAAQAEAPSRKATAGLSIFEVPLANLKLSSDVELLQNFGLKIWSLEHDLG